MSVFAFVFTLRKEHIKNRLIGDLADSLAPDILGDSSVSISEGSLSNALNKLPRC